MYHSPAASYDNPATLLANVYGTTALPSAVANQNGGGYIDGNPNPYLTSSSPPYSSSLATHHPFNGRSIIPSIPNHISDPNPANLSPFYSYPQHQHAASSPSSSSDFLDGSVRRVYSTGDLQGINGPHLENYGQEAAAIAGGQVGRYSAEERRERIERYRSKRNQRNFHKKITYACRKTLADSRPRIRGRFARNGETENEAEAAETSYECYGYSDSRSSEGEWWRQMQAAVGAMEEEEKASVYDEDLLASYVDIFSMNLL